MVNSSVFWFLWTAILFPEYSQVKYTRISLQNKRKSLSSFLCVPSIFVLLLFLPWNTFVIISLFNFYVLTKCIVITLGNQYVFHGYFLRQLFSICFGINPQFFHDGHQSPLSLNNCNTTILQSPAPSILHICPWQGVKFLRCYYNRKHDFLKNILFCVLLYCWIISIFSVDKARRHRSASCIYVVFFLIKSPQGR